MSMFTKAAAKLSVRNYESETHVKRLLPSRYSNTIRHVEVVIGVRRKAKGEATAETIPPLLHFRHVLSISRSPKPVDFLDEALAYNSTFIEVLHHDGGVTEFVAFREGGNIFPQLVAAWLHFHMRVMCHIPVAVSVVMKTQGVSKHALYESLENDIIGCSWTSLRRKCRYLKELAEAGLHDRVLKENFFRGRLFPHLIYSLQLLARAYGAYTEHQPVETRPPPSFGQRTLPPLTPSTPGTARFDAFPLPVSPSPKSNRSFFGDGRPPMTPVRGQAGFATPTTQLTPLSATPSRLNSSTIQGQLAAELRYRHPLSTSSTHTRAASASFPLTPSGAPVHLHEKEEDILLNMIRDQDPGVLKYGRSILYLLFAMLFNSESIPDRQRVLHPGHVSFRAMVESILSIECHRLGSPAAFDFPISSSSPAFAGKGCTPIGLPRSVLLGGSLPMPALDFRMPKLHRRAASEPLPADGAALPPRYPAEENGLQSFRRQPPPLQIPPSNGADTRFPFPGGSPYDGPREPPMRDLSSSIKRAQARSSALFNLRQTIARKLQDQFLRFTDRDVASGWREGGSGPGSVASQGSLNTAGGSVNASTLQPFAGGYPGAGPGYSPHASAQATSGLDAAQQELELTRYLEHRFGEEGWQGAEQPRSVGAGPQASAAMTPPSGLWRQSRDPARGLGATDTFHHVAAAGAAAILRALQLRGFNVAFPQGPRSSVAPPHGMVGPSSVDAEWLFRTLSFDFHTAVLAVSDHEAPQRDGPSKSLRWEDGQGGGLPMGSPGSVKSWRSKGSFESRGPPEDSEAAQDAALPSCFTDIGGMVEWKDCRSLPLQDLQIALLTTIQSVAESAAAEPQGGATVPSCLAVGAKYFRETLLELLLMEVADMVDVIHQFWLSRGGQSAEQSIQLKEERLRDLRERKAAEGKKQVVRKASVGQAAKLAATLALNAVVDLLDSAATSGGERLPSGLIGRAGAVPPTLVLRLYHYSQLLDAYLREQSRVAMSISVEVLQHARSQLEKAAPLLPSCSPNIVLMQGIATVARLANRISV